MLQLDDVQLYDLSEAGALLFSDALRLDRLARLRQVPAARVGEEMGLPKPWVEAEAGQSGADPLSLRMYWLERLAPPAANARRPQKPLSKLPAEDLVGVQEACRRLCATQPALERMTADGRLPSLLIDGEVRYDAQLVDMLGAEDGEPTPQLAQRRAEVRTWARFEYRTDAAPALEATPSVTPTPTAFTFPKVESEEPATPSPGAYQIPSDLGMDDIEPLAGEGDPDEAPPSTLIDVEGFETVDED